MTKRSSTDPGQKGQAEAVDVLRPSLANWLWAALAGTHAWIYIYGQAVKINIFENPPEESRAVKYYFRVNVNVFLFIS